MSNARTKKPITLRSHLYIKQFLDNRKAEGRETCNVAGEERKALSRAVWPLLTQKQRNNYGNVDSHRFYKWLTETMASIREYVVQPNKCNDRFASSKRANVGDSNNHTKTFQHDKNQKPNIQASKATHEQNNPGRMRKHHGTVAKKTAQRKYRLSDRGMKLEAAHRERRRARREASLWEQLEKNTRDGKKGLDKDGIHRLVNKVFHTKGKVVKEFPNLTLYECVEQRKVVAYLGLARWKDRMWCEPYRFLVEKNENNRSVIQWQHDPSTPATKITLGEAQNLLGFKSVTVYRHASLCGLGSYMVERSLQKEIEDFTLGKQRLNRVTGAGNKYKDCPGFYHVFVTYALTSTLKKFSALAIIPNARKKEKNEKKM